MAKSVAKGKSNCSLIEQVGRKTKNRRGVVVAAMDDVCPQSHRARRLP